MSNEQPMTPPDADRAPRGHAAGASPGAAAARAAADAHDGKAHAPPPRDRAWDEPARQEPILDAARVPLQTLLARRSLRYALGSWLWFRLLRPLLVIGFWAFVVFYAYRHFFRPTEQMDDYELLGEYGLLVLGIFTMMLLLAPLRRQVHAQEEVGPRAPLDTGREVASYTDVPAEALSTLQQARRVVVEHDHNARMRAGADLDTGPRVPGPTVTPTPTPRKVNPFDRRAATR